MGDKNLKKNVATNCGRILSQRSCSSVPRCGDRGKDADVDVVIVSEAGMPLSSACPAVLKNISFEKHIDAICACRTNMKE